MRADDVAATRCHGKGNSISNSHRVVVCLCGGVFSMRGAFGVRKRMRGKQDGFSRCHVNARGASCAAVPLCLRALRLIAKEACGLWRVAAGTH
eukprot:228907-Chlamydomonas_euryale.AAC.3